MKTFNKKKGFTIVELVIVIAVIGVLTAILVPTFVNLTNKANQAADESLVKNLNTQLRMKEQTEGKNATLTDALEDAKEGGYLVENLTPRGSRDIVWNQDKDEFSLLEGAPAENAYKFWKIYEKAEDIPEIQTYSIYAKGVEWAAVPTLTVGFDAGENEAIPSIRYTNTSGVGKHVLVRTNSFSTNFDINAPLDTVSHFGDVGKVTIEKIDMNCYNEIGSAAYVKITEGKVVAKDGGKISVAFAANTDGSKVAITEDGGEVETGYTVVQPVADANEAREGGIPLTYSIDGEHAASATPEEIAAAADQIESTGELSVASETGVQPEGMDYTAVVNNVGYDSLSEAINTAAAGSTVSLLKDVNIGVSEAMGEVHFEWKAQKASKSRPAGFRYLTVGLIINKSLTLNGNGHTVTTSTKNSALGDFNGASLAITAANVNLTLKRLNMTTSNLSSVFVGENLSGVKLNVEESSLKAASYTIKTCNGADNGTYTFTKSSLTGWAAINARGNNCKFNVVDSDLSGENTAAEASSNNYASFVIDGDTYNDNTTPAGTHGSRNEVTITNSKISATSATANEQNWLAIQYGAINNRVTVDVLSVLTNPGSWTFTDSEEGPTNTVKVAGTTLPGVLDE